MYFKIIKDVQLFKKTSLEKYETASVILKVICYTLLHIATVQDWDQFQIKVPIKHL